MHILECVQNRCLLKSRILDAMLELYQEAIAPHNLPLTLLLGALVLYWLLVLAGILDFDLDILEIGDVAADIGDAADTTHGQLGGLWLNFGKALGFAKVPILIWGSFFTLFLWAANVALNYHYNGTPNERSMSMAMLLFVPGVLGSLVATKIITLPLGSLFKAMAESAAENVQVIGQTGIVVSAEATDQFGQLQIGNEGAPVLLNVRLTPGSAPLIKGASAKIITASPDGKFYLIEPA